MWKAGDRAYCFRGFTILQRKRALDLVPEVGKVYYVTELQTGGTPLGLILLGCPGPNTEGLEVGWEAGAFDRVVPRSEREEKKSVFAGEYVTLRLHCKQHFQEPAIVVVSVNGMKLTMPRDVALCIPVNFKTCLEYTPGPDFDLLGSGTEREFLQLCADGVIGVSMLTDDMLKRWQERLHSLEDE